MPEGIRYVAMSAINTENAAPFPYELEIAARASRIFIDSHSRD